VFSQSAVNALLVSNTAIHAGGDNWTVFHTPRRGLAGYGISDLTTGLPINTRTSLDGHDALLWPNPYAGGPLQFELNIGAAQCAPKAEVLDVSGRSVGTLYCTSAVPTSTGQLRVALSGMEELAPGPYLVQINSGDRVSVSRLMVEK